MSERTTIGGTVYEAIGSSSSNLLLKCNGTARIQWGNKLIDLIKNGKIASGDSKLLIFTVSDESEIQTDGIYVLTTEESNKLLVYKDGIKYNFTEENLYILANESLNLTSEQKEQALKNIGLYYNNLEDVYKADIKNGIVYVLDTNNLYIIKNGVIEEFLATLKSVTVDEETDGVKVINSSVKIILSILDEEYLVLADLRITANYSIHVKNSAQLGSESADETLGYRLYIDGNTSYLDVDEINVRNGIKVKLYEEVDFKEFDALLNNDLLEPHVWYLITDFLNHWRLVTKNSNFDRPILVRALTNNSLYEWGYLFKNHSIKIKYDPTYKENITLTIVENELLTQVEVTARGKITWMLDERNNNQSNFDFMDYKDYNDEPLTTLHPIYNDDSKDLSIFPYKSHDNTIIVYDLKGTILKDKKLNDENTVLLDFKYLDENQETSMIMYNNHIICRGLVLLGSCVEFHDNILHHVVKLEISNLFVNNNLNCVYNHSEFINYEDFEIRFESLQDISKYNPIPFQYKIDNVTCEQLRHCKFNSILENCKFGIIENCIFSKEIVGSSILLVIRPNPQYFYQLDKIVNSTIGEISYEATFLDGIFNSTIDLITQGVIIGRSIENCTIKQISNLCSIYETLAGSTIDYISNLVNITKSITDSVIVNIENNSTIDSEISTSAINSINNSSISGSITESEIKDVNNSTINAEINKSTINSINNSTIQGSLIRSVIEDIANTDINGDIHKSTFFTLKGSDINSSVYNSKFESINNSYINSSITHSIFGEISGTHFNSSIDRGIFEEVSSCVFDASMNDVEFRSLSGCTFSSGDISNVTSFYSLSGSFSPSSHILLYNSSKRKEIYITDKGLKIVCIPDVIFYRGMIIMHSGIEEIPKGWAPCDGGTYEWEGVKSKTPNLINKFIKSGDGFIMGSNAVGDNNDTIDPNLTKDNKLKLTKDHLPTHRHPHLPHTHSASYADSNYVDSYSYSYTDSTGEDSHTEYDTSYLNRSVSHTHTIYAATSVEESIEFENKLFSIEPHAYKLIFIMKL